MVCMTSQAEPELPLPEPHSVLVTEDGGVRKLILHAGTGALVPLHSRCLVHYVAKLAGSGEVFMDTRAESATGDPIQVVAGRDSTLQQVGLNLGVASMRKGERCRLSVTSQYGYGEKGSFSFPAVPPRCDLTYEIELVEFEAVDEVQAHTSMMYEDRLEASERRRLEGNRLFADGQSVDALGKYAMGLSHMNEDFLMQLEGVHLDKANAVRLPILLNMAACHLRLEDWASAVSCASQVLIMDSANAKALFRRGKARHKLQQTEEAEADLKLAAQRSPGDRAITVELQAVRQSLRADRQAQSRMFKGRLKPDPDPQASQSGAGQSWLEYILVAVTSRFRLLLVPFRTWGGRK